MRWFFIKNIKIGIPQSLIFYKYQTLYYHFFNKLNIELITEPISEEITKIGEQYLEPEACYHLKNFIGSITKLALKCDYILVPDIKSIKVEECTCPIIANLYEITKSIFPKLNILTYTLDVNNKKDELTGLVTLCQKLNIPYFEIVTAYRTAKQNEELYYQNKYYQTKEKLGAAENQIFVISNFYTMPIIKETFSKIHANFIYSDYLDYRYNQIDNLKISTSLKDTFTKEFIKALENNISKIDGIILVAEENCFLTSITFELIKNKIVSLPILRLDFRDHNLIDKVYTFIKNIQEKEVINETSN